jgi:hypothetical protein
MASFAWHPAVYPRGHVTTSSVVASCFSPGGGQNSHQGTTDVMVAQHTNNIKNIIASCSMCRECLPSQAKQPLLDKAATKPYQCIHADLFQLHRNNYLITVDECMGWPTLTALGKNTIIKNVTAVFLLCTVPQSEGRQMGAPNSPCQK